MTTFESAAPPLSARVSSSQPGASNLNIIFSAYACRVGVLSLILRFPHPRATFVVVRQRCPPPSASHEYCRFFSSTTISVCHLRFTDLRFFSSTRSRPASAPRGSASSCPRRRFGVQLTLLNLRLFADSYCRVGALDCHVRFLLQAFTACASSAQRPSPGCADATTPTESG